VDVRYNLHLILERVASSVSDVEHDVIFRF